MRSLSSWDNRAEAVKFMSSPILIYRTASTKSWNMVCCGILFITVAVLRIWSITKSQVSSQTSWAGCGAWSGRGRGWKNALHLSFHAVWNKFVWVCVWVPACVCLWWLQLWPMSRLEQPFTGSLDTDVSFPTPAVTSAVSRCMCCACVRVPLDPLLMLVKSPLPHFLL